MAISFSDARQIVESVASENSITFMQDEEILSLELAIGRSVKYDIRSPIDTPTFDSSAMDGYAVIASQTANTSPKNPTRLRILGTMAAGDQPIVVDHEIVDGFVPCVEIMTGAPFPLTQDSSVSFDACIPWERTRHVETRTGGNIIEIDSPAPLGWNMRLVGSNSRAGDLVVAKDTIVAPKHVMALASVGLNSVTVTRSVRIAVLSTGSEVVGPGLPVNTEEQRYRIPDANGPYLMAAVRAMGAEATLLGPYADDLEVLTECLRKLVHEGTYDLIISSGGVSSGTYDHVPTCVEKLQGNVYFHHVAMKPGHPSLFATLPFITRPVECVIPSETSSPTLAHSEPRRKNVLFALPGNPVASAACFSFLVTPYIRRLIGQSEEKEIWATVIGPPDTAKFCVADGADVKQSVVEGSPNLDIFRHACIRWMKTSPFVEINRERSPAKTSPFSLSNCWVHVPRGLARIRADDLAAWSGRERKTGEEVAGAVCCRSA